MTKRIMRQPRARSPFLLLALAAPLALLALPACEPEVPAAPTYAANVQPILAAHCVRCHGANGMLNATPGLSTPVAAPLICYLNMYDDNPVGCTTGSCQHGAKYCANLISTYINYPDDSPLRMPPYPSSPLNDWEKDVLTRWTSKNPPAP